MHKKQISEIFNFLSHFFRIDMKCADVLLETENRFATRRKFFLLQKKSFWIIYRSFLHWNLSYLSLFLYFPGNKIYLVPKCFLFSAKTDIIFAAREKIQLRQKNLSSCCKTKISFCGNKIFLLQLKDLIFATKGKSRYGFIFVEKNVISVCTHISVHIFSFQKWLLPF